MCATASLWKAASSYASQVPGLLNCKHFSRGWKTSFLLLQVLLFTVCVYIYMSMYFVAFPN